jgi:hypothetical protein
MIGTSMLGKISTGMRNAASVPTRKISSAATVNVYGRCSAVRTMPSMGLPERASETRGRVIQWTAGRTLAVGVATAPAGGAACEANALPLLNSQASSAMMTIAAPRVSHR